MPIVLCVVFGLALVLILASLYVPSVNKTFSPYMYSEGAGRRQYDYKYLGFIPYSKVVMVPNLETAKKAQAQFDGAGIVLPPGYGTTDKGADAVRMYHQTGEASHLSFQNPKDPKALYAFFKAQALSPRQDSLSPDGSFELNWDSANGKETVRVYVISSVDRKTGKVNSQSLSVNVSPK